MKILSIHVQISVKLTAPNILCGHSSGSNALVSNKYGIGFEYIFRTKKVN